MKDQVKDKYTKEDLDEVVETLVNASDILNDDQLMKLVKDHAKSREKQLENVQNFSKNEPITSIQDIRNARYRMYEDGEEPSDENDGDVKSAVKEKKASKMKKAKSPSLK